MFCVAVLLVFVLFVLFVLFIFVVFLFVVFLFVIFQPHVQDSLARSFEDLTTERADALVQTLQAISKSESIFQKKVSRPGTYHKERHHSDSDDNPADR